MIGSSDTDFISDLAISSFREALGLEWVQIAMSWGLSEYTVMVKVRPFIII